MPMSESLKFLLFLLVCLLQTLSLSYFGNCIIDAVSPCSTIFKSIFPPTNGSNWDKRCIWRVPVDFLNGNISDIVVSFRNFHHCIISIRVQSSSVGDRIYESDWLEGDLTSKKFILFIILRSRRPVCLRAETFSIVSLASFGSVRVDIIFYLSYCC